MGVPRAASRGVGGEGACKAQSQVRLLLGQGSQHLVATRDL